MEEEEKPKNKLDQRVHLYFNMLKYTQLFTSLP
jgi:hypothetical protein